MCNQFLRVFCEVPCLPTKYYRHFNMLQTFCKKYLATLSSEVCIVLWMQNESVTQDTASSVVGYSGGLLQGVGPDKSDNNKRFMTVQWAKLIQNQCVVIPRCFWQCAFMCTLQFHCRRGSECATSTLGSVCAFMLHNTNHWFRAIASNELQCFIRNICCCYRNSNGAIAEKKGFNRVLFPFFVI